MVIKWDVTLPELSGDRTRRAFLYLPDNYDDEPLRRYPVLYMFDGHNVFFDSDATYGKSWGMNSYMTQTRKQMIIVAVECDHKGKNRLREYSPVNSATPELGSIRGRGKAYMDWLVNVLKPRIDAEFRTMPDRAHTAICGSSMGGLMSLYAVSEYNTVFSLAACLSPSLWVAPDKMRKLVEKTQMDPDTCIYMDYGSEELRNHDASRAALADMSALLFQKGVNVTFRVVPGGTHCEASWEKQIPVFMECLGL